MGWGDSERPGPGEDQGTWRSRKDEIHQEEGLLSLAALPSWQLWELFSFLGALSTSCSTTQQVLYASSQLSHQNNSNESFMPQKSFIMNQEGDSPELLLASAQISKLPASFPPILPPKPSIPCPTHPALLLRPLLGHLDRPRSFSSSPRQQIPQGFPCLPPPPFLLGPKSLSEAELGTCLMLTPI
jgi:hypothetical protein